VSAEDGAEAAKRAGILAESLRRQADGGEEDVLGPAPAPLARLRGRHRWHVLVRGRHGKVQQIVRAALASVGDLAPAVLAVDVDPVSLM